MGPSSSTPSQSYLTRLTHSIMRRTVPVLRIAKRHSIARSARLDSVALPPMCTTTILYASTGRCTHQLSFVHLLMPRARSLLAATTFIMWRGPSCRCRRHRRHRSHRSHRLRLHCLCNHHLQRHHLRLQRRCRRLGRHYYHRLPHRSTLHHHLSPSRHRRQEYGQC